MDHFNEGWPAGDASRPPGAGQGRAGFPPAGPGAGSIIGGLPWGPPWSANVEASKSPLPFPAPPPSPAKPVASKPTGDRLRRFVARSPAWSASLSIHVGLLLVLALWVIRREVAQSRIITLSFVEAARPVAQPAADVVEIVKIPEPSPPAAKRPEPTPEPVPKASQPVVPEPEPTPSPVVAPPSDQPSRTAGDARTAITSQLSGRGESGRGDRIGAAGGTAGTENAVARALGWLAKNADKKDGLWSLTGPYADGGSQENRLAATAMALLALQGAGTTPSAGRHADIVERGWKTLLKRQREEGTFQLGPIPDQHQMYAHAQITIALCEAFGMTGDERFAEPARKAVRYCLAAQMPDGGWRYRLPEPNHENKGDMSVTGWFLMALKTAEMAGLEVPSENYTRLESFLDNVFISDEKGYAYQINPHQKIVDFRPAITAEGLLCRQYLGWSRTDPRLVAGMKLLLDNSPLDFDHRSKNVYAWYYQTQVFHHAGGEAWEAWNEVLRERLPAEQVKRGPEAGSWERANDQWGHIGGRLYVTCLCTLMLESYYRHLPIYGDAR
jgi:hypothetical protein